MNAHTTRLANPKRAMDIYNARNAYYKLLKVWPTLNSLVSRVTFGGISGLPEYYIVFECKEGKLSVALNERRVHVDLKG